MSKVLDPTKAARRQAAVQAQELAKQKQRQTLEKAEAESEVAAVKGRAQDPAKGRRSLISGVQKKLKDNLG